MMKRYILTFLFFVCLFSAKAQTFNVKTGPAFSKINWYNSLSGDNPYYKNYVGMTATFGIDYLQKKNFMLSSNMGYILLGGKGEILSVDPGNPNNNKMIDVLTSLHFLTLNTTASFKFKLGNKIAPYIGFGPRLNYLISYNESVAFLSQFEKADNLHKVIFGFMGTAGIHYRVSNFQLGLEFQYNYNLNSLVDSRSQWNVENKISLEDYAVAFSFGYIIK